MKAMAIAIILLGIIAFWEFSILKGGTQRRDESRGQAAAANYIIFRNAAFDYVFSQKELEPQTLGPDHPALDLPQGWKEFSPWRAIIAREDDGHMYCYVHGPASSEVAEAVRNLLNQSAAVGWNDAGFLVRNGRPWPLPTAIAQGDVVSVIRIDK